MPDENTQNGPPSGPVAKIISLASAKFVKSVKQREARSSFLMKSSHSVESLRGYPIEYQDFYSIAPGSSAESLGDRLYGRPLDL